MSGILRKEGFPDRFRLDDRKIISIMKVARRFDYQSVSAESRMEDMIGRAMEQNFVPVVDDQENFIGIITRRDIISYCYSQMMMQGGDLL